MEKMLAYLIRALILLLISQSAWSQNIAMVLWRGETEAEQGFKDQLTNMGYTPSFTIFDAAQNKTSLGKILRVELRPNLDKYDYIYTFGTTISKATQQVLKQQKPQLFNIVADPVGAELLPNYTEGKVNIAGASNTIDHEALIQAAKNKLKFQTLAVPFNPKEKNTKIQLEKIIKLGETYNFTTIPVRVNPEESIYLSNIRNITQQANIDAVYFVPDSFMISHSQHIMPMLTQAKLPTICSVTKYIKNGCYMGMGASYYELGKKVAKLIDSHQKGKALKDMPVQFDLQPKLIINKETQSQLDP